MTETAALARAPLDGSKHVNFTLGMVLGVDDFDQEFTYHAERDRRLTRDLHGYGTTAGLAVTIEVDSEQGPRVNVSPGTAITPCGHLVCVSPAQCAFLNEWLLAHQEEVHAALAARGQLSPPSGTLALYVVLRYADCPTDELPIPGEPCRTEDSLTAASRLQDDFRLELSLTRPEQQEEDAVRDLVQWLRLIPIVDGPGSTTAELLAELRIAVAEAAARYASPPSSPPSSLLASAPSADAGPDLPYDFVWSTPPPQLAFGIDGLAEQLRALFNLWVTELRPAARQRVPGCSQSCSGGCDCSSAGASGCGCGAGFGVAGAGRALGTTCPDRLLLAEVDLSLVEQLDGSLVVADGGWQVDQTERPYLLHTRLLQEWLLTSAAAVLLGSPPSGDSSEPPINAVTAFQVTGPPTATWDAGTLTLDLGIPAGAGIDSVTVEPLLPGTPPAVVSFIGGDLKLGLANGRDGSPGPKGDKGDTGPPGTFSGPTIVAAGSFGPQGGVNWSFGKLIATPVPSFPLLYLLEFSAFVASHPYAVTGMAITAVTDPGHTIEVVRIEGTSVNENEVLTKVIDELASINKSPKQGILIRAAGIDQKNPTRGFTLEISDFFGVTD